MSLNRSCSCYTIIHRDTLYGRYVRARNLFLPITLLLQFLHSDKRLAFVDTSEVHWYESKYRGSFYNKKECKFVINTVSLLHARGVSSNDIGIISPYNRQIQWIRESLPQEASAVEVSTVDKFQGRDKTCIIVSFVRSNPEAYVSHSSLTHLDHDVHGRNAGTLLEDWRRINVSMTRARAKLIFIGDTWTLKSVPFLARIVDYMKEKDIIWQLC